MPWLSQSPDFNPVVHLWDFCNDVLDTTFQNHHQNTKHSNCIAKEREYWQYTKTEWKFWSFHVCPYSCCSAHPKVKYMFAFKEKKKVLRVDDCRVNQTHACLPIRMQLYTAHVTEHLLEHLLAHMLTRTQSVQGTDKSLMLSPGYTE